MASSEDRIVVTTGATQGSSTAHHRDFPEIRAEGETPSIAASQLVNHLTRALDSALTDWRRESIERAIADAQDYADRTGGA